MRRTAKLTRWLVAPAAAMMVCLSAAHADEGFDPMKQITSQWVRPDLLLIMDVSGSMAYDLYGITVGVDMAGTWPTATWSNTTSMNSSNGCTARGYPYNDYVAPCKKWTYRLRVSQTYPSRMCTVKNAMGNSITLITQWFTPGYTDAAPVGVWPAVDKNSWKIAGATVTGPTLTTTDGPPTLQDLVWGVTFNAAKADPGSPFNTDPAPLINAHPPTFGYSGADASKICQQLAPADLIGKTANTVNWGLETFSGTDCSTQTLNVAINSGDTGVVSALETAMNFTTNGGQDASGSTPTRGALQYAKTVMTNTFNADPKKTCGRTYGTILMTDGLSNNCNPSDKNWINPCLSDPPYQCDASGGSYDCDQRSGHVRNYTAFPAGKTEELYNLNLTAGGKTYKVRTWVVGVSNAVSPCELNFDAYMGRTDSNAPFGDAGFSLADDPYLPTATGDSSKYTISGSHASYAYFATTSAALQDALANILAALGAGDYSTAAPSLAASPTSNVSVGLLTSANYPSWQGHIYAYDLKNQTTRPDPYAFPLLWDAGTSLSTGTFDVTGDGVPDRNHGYTRMIYTWKWNSGVISTVQISDSSASTATTLNTICGSCGITQAVVDFLRGYDGTLTNTQRSWVLGAIINSTPALTGPPEIWQTGLLQNHQAFEQKYASRHNLAWVGSSDGMVHAIDLVDGAEILALLPPDLLSKQITLYNTYVTQTAKYATSAVVGQVKDPAQHVYGVANSQRFADVWDPTSSQYRTLLFITEGPGGTGIHAVDVTHAYPGRTQVPYKLWKHTPPVDDNDYTVGHKDYPADCTGTGCTTQITPLWGLTANGTAGTTALAELGQTWAVPALGASDVTTWELVVGAGWDPNKLTSGTPVVMRINPNTGAVTKYTGLTNETSGTYVHNQTFADSGVFQTNSAFFHPDNVVDQGVQLDLHGHVWLLNKGASPAWTPAKLTDASNLIKGNPLYYAAALAPFPSVSPTYDVYAFSSGTFYEKSATVSGPNIGTTGNFMPAVILAARKISDGSISIGRFYLKDMTLTSGGNLGTQTQITQYPLLLVPRPGTTGKAIGLYLVYDPKAGTCVGTSYVLVATFDPASVSGATFSLQSAGTGPASGYAVDPGGQIHPAQSFVGTGGQAYFPGSLTMPSLPSAGGLGGTIVWWAELQ
jgi:hypothetical protein